MRRGVTAHPAAGSVGLTLVGKFQSLLNREQNNERSVATMFYSSNVAWYIKLFTKQMIKGFMIVFKRKAINNPFHISSNLFVA